MKRILLACAAGLAMAMVPEQADAFGRVELGVNVRFRVNTNRGGFGLPQASPWYLYWPYEAHFTNPAPYGFPYWPTPQLAQGGPGAPSAPPSFVPPSPTPAPPSGFVPPPPGVAPPPPGLQPTAYPVNYVRPVNYSVPSYWYDR